MIETIVPSTSVSLARTGIIRVLSSIPFILSVTADGISLTEVIVIDPVWYVDE